MAWRAVLRIAAASDDMGAYKAYECDGHGTAPEEARAATSSGMTKEHTPECDDCLRKGDILSRGHVTVKSLISTKLSADVLDGVSMAKAAVISNALQQNLPGTSGAHLHH